MKTVGDVFRAAMSVMDELGPEGEDRRADTLEYEHRAPGILNGLVSEYVMLTGGEDLIPVEGVADDLLGVPDVYALGVLHYGLAANLLVDENATAASFFQQRYEELRDRYVSRVPAVCGQVEELYGGIEYGQFGRW